jgi:uncharacterized protein (DUF433 family)
MNNLGTSIRGQNIKVSDLLRWLGDGMSEERIMQDHPGLEHEDFWRSTIMRLSPST